ncbi:NAD(P)-dependent oxidoreductase [Planctomonas psychrotolerans]|uniref:NAD(P)-dependent oxidoreductase n=1 Tax=Planctomonas psychrotolerans TaxID=2528712 RepID=UPI00123BD3ED|nr:NAD(P)-dependent oxidoreductase [Planctomonas psychrotolerans]
MTSPSLISLTFVGVGAIGLPMATLLSRAGHAVTGVDPFPAARERAAEAGFDAVASFSDASASDTVVVMVATPDQLSALVTEALTTDAVSGTTWILMSTVGPAAVRTEADRLGNAGATVIDAPVTGGVARAVTGDLVIFASGADADLDSVQPLLEVLGTVRRVGAAVGDGQAIKVVNQHLCSVHIVAAAEALWLAESLGLDRSAVLDLVSGGAAGSWMLSDRGPRMLLGTDAPVTSSVNIFVKDSGLVADAAESSGASVPLLEVARDRFTSAAERGLGLRDDSRVIETYER